MVWKWIMEWAGLFAIVGLWLYACKWRRTVSERLFRYALASDRKEDREELAGRAVMAGNRSARLLYALNSPELFDKARPMRPFLFGKIPCIFADYYFAQRYEDWLRTEQTDFVQDVYAFKDGEEDCREYFARMFRMLFPEGGVTAVFMPCSTARRYYKRFGGIAAFLENEGYAWSGLYLIRITEDRESKHTASRRSAVDTNNYVMSTELRGKRVVICDDLLTTGDSLFDYARNLERCGAEVAGAVFLARTFQVPSSSGIRWVAWKRRLAAWAGGKR